MKGVEKNPDRGEEHRRLREAPVGLSPLAGVSDRTFRSLCFAQGCDFAVTEMVSARALAYEDARSLHLLEKGPQEGRLLVQLFGSDPKDFETALRKHPSVFARFDGIDLNMGCPAPKITKNGEGSALMKEPMRAARIVRTLVRCAAVPVSVKFRLGWDEAHQNYIEIGKMAQEEGSSHVTLHGRTTTQQYAGKADWVAVAALVDALSIPVFGNGDVDSPEQAEARLLETGCYGIAIGRGALGNPFLFRQICSYRETGRYEPVCRKERLNFLEALYRGEIAQKGHRVAVLEMRKHIGWALTGLVGSAAVKREINVLTDVDAVLARLRTFLDGENPDC